MNIKTIIVILTGMIVASCSNDNDYYPICYDECDWTLSMKEIVSDNSQLFEHRGLNISNMKLSKGIKVDKNLFFGDEYGIFPVYSLKDSIFTVVTYRDLKNNIESYSFDTISVMNNINRILEHADEYDVVELTWTFDNKPYKSLALFNKCTGELEYDNMLFNMATLARYESNTFSRALHFTETESGVGASGSDYVEYKIGNTIIAKSGINWQVNGNWNKRLDLDYDDDRYYYYTVYSTFTIGNVSISPITYVLPGSDGDTFFDKRDLSVRGSSTYHILYAIWAGPKNALDLSSNGNNYSAYNICEPSTTFASRIRGGQGRLVEITQMISPTWGDVRMEKNN